jgi:hypothetical protein
MKSNRLPFTASPQVFVRFVQARLLDLPPVKFDFDLHGDPRHISAVLFLLSLDADKKPILILNKRSQKVRQPGDLCCPGGGVLTGTDHLLASSLNFPTPFSLYLKPRRWRQRYCGDDWRKMTLLTATALREGLEEMRLNPFGVRLLGMMPAQQLALFQRTIHPLVGWVRRQRRFFPNWEVERIVRIPLEDLFDTDRYARYRISMENNAPGGSDIPHRDMPAFVHRRKERRELLWGATYRLVEQFLMAVFNFRVPSMDSLGVIHGRLDGHYLKGTGATGQR